MATPAELQTAVSGALAGQPRNVSYPDYKTTDDFPRWLSGYEAKIRTAYKLKYNDRAGVQTEVIDQLAGKLSVGTALDAYTRLPDADKADYTRLITKLTSEFVDPIEARNFNENLEYNKRKKGQTLKDFEQAIKKDMARYSTLPAKVMNAAGDALVENPEREIQGIRRFRMGIRNRHGKKDSTMKRQLLYNLIKLKEQTWENAMDIASRWELADYEEGAAKEKKKESSSSSSSSSSSDDEDCVEAVEATKPKKSSKTSKKGKGKGKAEKNIIAALEQTPFIATLSDKVQENQVKIKQMETSQERMSTQLKEVKESVDVNNSSLQNIEAKLDAGFAQTGRNYQPNFSFQQQNRPQQQQFRPQQQQYRQQQQYGQNNQRGGGSTFRGQPRNYTWSANTQQQRQGNYGLQRRTPTNYTPQVQTQPNAQTKQTTPAVTGAVSKPVASMEDEELSAEPLCATEEEDTVTLNINEFMALSQQAGYDPDEIDLGAAVDQLNFQ